MQIELPTIEIVAFCQRWYVTEMALFGSVLRDDFQPDSDVDVMVTFAEGAPIGLFEMMHMQDELEAIFDRKVDLITRKSIERSHNWIRRQHILDSIHPIYRHEQQHELA